MGLGRLHSARLVCIAGAFVVFILFVLFWFGCSSTEDAWMHG
jgi:hypothetical protein